MERVNPPLQRPPVPPPRIRRRVVSSSFICRFLSYRCCGLWWFFIAVLLCLRQAYLLHQRLTGILIPDQSAPNFHQWDLKNYSCTETTLLGPCSQCFANLSRVPALSGDSTVDVRVLGLALNISIASLDKSRTHILALLENHNQTSTSRDHLIIPHKDSLGLCMALIERTLDHLQAAGAGADLDSSTACRRRRSLELLLSMAVEDQESCLRELRDKSGGSQGQNRLKNVVKQLEFPNLRMVNSALTLAGDLEKSCWNWKNVNNQEGEIISNVLSSDPTVDRSHHHGSHRHGHRQRHRHRHRHRHPPMLYRSSPGLPSWSGNGSGKTTAGAVEEKKKVQRRSSSSSSSDDYWEL